MTEWREYQSDSEYPQRYLDPSCQNEVSEMAELDEKVRSDVGRPMSRPGIEGARALRVPDTIHENMHQSSGFASTPALISSQFLDLHRLTLVTDHE